MRGQVLDYKKASIQCPSNGLWEAALVSKRKVEQFVVRSFIPASQLPKHISFRNRWYVDQAQGRRSYHLQLVRIALFDEWIWRPTGPAAYSVHNSLSRNHLPLQLASLQNRWQIFLQKEPLLDQLLCRLLEFAHVLCLRGISLGNRRSRIARLFALFRCLCQRDP